MTFFSPNTAQGDIDSGNVWASKTITRLNVPHKELRPCAGKDLQQLMKELSHMLLHDMQMRRLSHNTELLCLSNEPWRFGHAAPNEGRSKYIQQ